MIAKIISGGQTGCDRAALDVALELGIPCGGYCPRGRKAEDGRIPDRYPLTELESDDYPTRTRMNVLAADAVLLLIPPQTVDLRRGYVLTGGTKLTYDCARRCGVPCLVISLGEGGPLPGLIEWISDLSDLEKRLMIAGPRESKSPGIYDRARAFLLALLTSLSER